MTRRGIRAARAETFPNTILEALACGVPVVATAVGGIVEQVRSLAREAPSLSQTAPAFDARSATGVLVPLGDAEALALAITALLGDAELRRTLCMNAARDARERFDFRNQVSAYLAWYHEVVAG